MCDSIVVAGSRTASGATLFAKNSDRHRGECQPLLQFPEAIHSRGTRLRCTHIEIPQAASTYRVMGHSPHWVWGFEQGVNELAVAIGNHTVFSREPVEERPGLIGMDLVRLGLERGATAREALEEICMLLEEFGQGGAAFGPGEAGYHNSFTLADPREAWQLETSGRHWAARRVECGALSNQYCIGDDWTLASKKLQRFAREQGWAEDRTRAGERLHVERAYRNSMVPGRISEPRIARSRGWLEGEARSFELSDAIELLRDHGTEGEGPPLARSLEEDERFSICMHAEPVGTTTASLVTLLPNEGDPQRASLGEGGNVWPVWVSFGSPCVGVFLPVYLAGVLPAELASTDPSVGAWPAFARLAALLESDDSAARVARVRAAWLPFERELESERRSIESRAVEARRAGEVEAAADLLSHFMRESWAGALRTLEGIA